MYIMKILKEKQLLSVWHYETFENAMADVADHKVFDDIPDEIINSMGEWGNPKIFCHSYNDEAELADNFEFIYPCGIIIYIGKVLTEEAKKRSFKMRKE